MADYGGSSSSSNNTAEAAAAVAVNTIINEDWEEWDGTSPFWIHCVAGSIAGVVEHTAIFPLDTVRTHIQVCAACIQRNLNTTTATATSSNSNNAITGSSSSLLRGASNSASSAATASITTASSTTSTQHSPQRLPLGMMQTIRYLVNEPILSSTTATTSTAAAVAADSSSIFRTATSELASATSTSSTAMVAGWSRLFRGIQTVLIGCVPAHALYFSSYETVKAAFETNSSTTTTSGQHQHSVSALGSSLAGAAAVTSHDIIMTPIDTVKQRLQIGHYQNAYHAAQSIYYKEGFVAFYRSFPITLISNIPYGMVMVTTHETCKELLHDHYYSRNLHESYHHQPQQWPLVLLSSSIAGLVASAITTPLDRIKTALQTQQLTPICGRRRLHCPLQQQQSTMTKSSASTTTATSSKKTTSTIAQLPPKHMNWYHAAQTILKEEGMIGFWRGVLPRILSHTPAVAISWTTYETVKQYLLLPHSTSFSQH